VEGPVSKLKKINRAYALSLVDKYILPDGSPPPESDQPFDEGDVKDLVSLMAFLYWATMSEALYGGVRSADALKAFSRLTGFTPAQIRMVVMGDEQ
jgi:hypothetical protein